MLRPLLAMIALSQLILAALTLCVPVGFATWMGLTPPPEDSAYLMAMLGGRFLVLGVILADQARRAQPDGGWVLAMAAIQAVDFAAGALLLAQGVISLATAALPMVNAGLFSCGLWLLRPASGSPSLLRGRAHAPR